MLYGHDQIVAKLDSLRDNALYVEVITADTALPKRRRTQGKVKGKTSATELLAVTHPDPSTSRPSDAKHMDDPVSYPQSAAADGHPLSGLVDVHAEMYFLPDFLTFSNLLVYLHQTYTMQLRPVSTHFP